MPKDKECFFLAPIGEEGSVVREQSDKTMEYIVKKSVTEYGYNVTRSDKINQPGSITSTIIEKTIECDLVIADLSGHNPNVFYELAVRHATGKPYIQIINKDDSLPFDISDFRTVHYDLDDVEEAEKARNRIQSQLEAIQEQEIDCENPISKSAELASLRESKNPSENSLAEVVESVSRIERKLEEINSESRDSSPTPSPDDDLVRIGTTVYDLEGEVSPHFIESLADRHELPKEDIESKLKDKDIDITT
jgi:hypothetical protein